MNDAQNDNTIPTIHDFDFDLICEFFLSLDRQGPGSPEMTLRALSFIEGLSASSRIADIGCGTGGQTMTLAAATPGRITGVDLFPAFIDRFNEQAREFNEADPSHSFGMTSRSAMSFRTNPQGEEESTIQRVRGVVGSMDALPFEPGSLDLVWSEGAIYNIGFERGLREWRQFLKPGGYVAVTENTWFTDERPKEIEDFWNAAYPEIDTIPAKIAAMGRAGYEFVAAFVLPESCWTDFYAPYPEAQKAFLQKHAGNPAAEAFVAAERYEKSLWDKYKAYYGYLFYIGRRG